jgi:hypothetical protein
VTGQRARSVSSHSQKDHLLEFNGAKFVSYSRQVGLVDCELKTQSCVCGEIALSVPTDRDPATAIPGESDGKIGFDWVKNRLPA